MYSKLLVILVVALKSSKRKPYNKSQIKQKMDAIKEQVKQGKRDIYYMDNRI
ncbi:MAG: hypothetical protein ACLFMM_08615 [Methanohalobium sp.]|uniref:hypothetical protein n=1 Tax=Methanohalobium sp. TaxID=2837493 RepID=UPI00397CB155